MATLTFLDVVFCRNRAISSLPFFTSVLSNTELATQGERSGSGYSWLKARIINKAVISATGPDKLAQEPGRLLRYTSSPEN